ncbi:hypothetical protein [Salinisphaera orenii]|uniref:hypothetical protein n=1 Tax=Salinisphaera orenii TaxID=856731 RepID=UPI000DBE8CFA
MTEEICDRLLTLQALYEQGNPQALLTAIEFCARIGEPMPRWVADAYCTRFEAWRDFEHKELGEAFGVAWPKGKSFESAKRKPHAGHVYGWVKCQHDVNEKPIDDELFEEAARFFNTNKTDAKQLYRAGKSNG